MLGKFICVFWGVPTYHFCKSLSLCNPFCQYHNFLLFCFIKRQLFSNQVFNSLKQLHVISERWHEVNIICVWVDMGPNEICIFSFICLEILYAVCCVKKPNLLLKKIAPWKKKICILWNMKEPAENTSNTTIFSHLHAPIRCKFISETQYNHAW